MKTRTKVVLWVLGVVVLFGLALLYFAFTAARYAPLHADIDSGGAPKKKVEALPKAAEETRRPVELPQIHPEKAEEAPKQGVDAAVKPPEQPALSIEEFLATAQPPKRPANELRISSDAPAMPQPDYKKPPVDTKALLSESTEKLKQLTPGNIAYNAPSTMKRSETAVIHLVLDLSAKTEELKEMITEIGEKKVARILVSTRMKAELTGADFTITEITPDTQVVAQGMATEWKWEVKPKSAGRHQLHLAVWALVSIEGETTSCAVKTYDSEIDVVVPWFDLVWDFIADNWQWLWGAILVPVAGWLWQRRKGKKAGAG